MIIKNMEKKLSPLNEPPEQGCLQVSLISQIFLFVRNNKESEIINYDNT